MFLLQSSEYESSTLFLFWKIFLPTQYKPLFENTCTLMYFHENVLPTCFRGLSKWLPKTVRASSNAALCCCPERLLFCQKLGGQIPTHDLCPCAYSGLHIITTSQLLSYQRRQSILLNYILILTTLLNHFKSPAYYRIYEVSQRKVHFPIELDYHPKYEVETEKP